MIRLLLGHCLERMSEIEDGSVDMVMADPPYGTTACAWDSMIPFEPMWAHLKRVVKPKGAIVLMASQPFTSALIMSNVKMFRCSWYWEKSKSAAFGICKIQPLRVVEEAVVFGKESTVYYPQMIRLEKSYVRDVTNISKSETTFLAHQNTGATEYTHKFPRNLLYAATDGDGRVHPTQKPVALMEYLIKTYTLEGETVLDFTMGSGTTGVAARLTGRGFIGIELDAGYFKIAKERIENTAQQFDLLEMEKQK